MRKKNITIYDIAKETGVSPTTVSRVLTNNPLVKESTRKLVLQKMEELDYRPNEAARSLTTKQTNMIGFILPDISNPFFSQVYIGVEREAQKKGYTILLRNSMNSIAMESTHLREFMERRVEAIVFMGGRINETTPDSRDVEELKEVLNKIPIIMVNGWMEGVDAHKIQTDEAEGIRLIMNHLISLGHKKIGLIGGIKGITSTDMKVTEFRREIEKYHLPFQEEWQIYSGFSVDDGKKAMKELLELDAKPTAIIGMNDMVLYGALKECREQQITVEDYSFVGFDDIFPSDIVYPSLTTVNHNYEILCFEIVETLQDIIENNNSTRKETIIPTSLIVRESTRQTLKK